MIKMPPARNLGYNIDIKAVTELLAGSQYTAKDWFQAFLSGEKLPFNGEDLVHKANELGLIIENGFKIENDFIQ